MTTSMRTNAELLLTHLRAVWADRRLRLVVNLIALAYLLLRWFLLLTSDDPLLAADAHTYWSAPYDNPYPGPQLGHPGAYLYPPPFIQVLAPLRLLPWEAFHAVWAALGFGALIFLVGPVGGAIAITLFSFVYRDLLVGNIHLMLAAAIVIGLRYPAIWAFPLLTKVTPGVGVLWFAGRREWRKLGIALATTAAVGLLSFSLTPEVWFDWVARLRGDTQTAGNVYVSLIALRLAVAALLVVYGGRTGRSWLIPIAVVLALPILWPDSLAILLACFPLLLRSTRERQTPIDGIAHP